MLNIKLTSGGVVATLGDRSVVGLETTDLGDRSIETRGFGTGECVPALSDFGVPLLSLLLVSLAVVGEALLGVSGKLDLLGFKRLTMIRNQN